MAVQTQIQTRRGAAATWTSTNPTLAAGEIGFESDTNKFKIGTGSTAWVSLPYASNVSPLTTKGDLYGFSTTNARLAVGANGETLVADSSTATGLSYAENYAAGKNKFINGDFYINQRAVSSTTSTNAFPFDRWKTLAQGGTSTYSSELFTLGTAPEAGYEGKTFLRIDSTGQSAASDRTAIRQYIESVRTFAGQTVTVSFWAKAGSGTPKVAIEITQEFGTGGSPSSAVNTYAGQATLSTSWTRHSLVIAVPSISGKTLGTANDDSLQVKFFTSAGTDFNARTGSLGIQTATIDFWGVQIEDGSVATAFQTATGTIQGELSNCMRYFQKVVRNSGWVLGNSSGTTIAYVAIPLQMEMRVTPTIVLPAAGQTSGTLSFLTAAGAYPTTTGTHTVTNTTVNGFQIDAASYVGLTSNTTAPFFINGANTVYTASAEL